MLHRRLSLLIRATTHSLSGSALPWSRLILGRGIQALKFDSKSAEQGTTAEWYPIYSGGTVRADRRKSKERRTEREKASSKASGIAAVARSPQDEDYKRKARPGRGRLLYHTYMYDVENRITNVQSSMDSINWDSNPLFNGNISSMALRVRKLDNPLLYNYRYDQLNRLLHMDAWKRTGSDWSAITKIADYQEDIGYDPNGNILRYKRNGTTAGGLDMDKLQYVYTAGTNKLDHIYDTVTAPNSYDDIETQSAQNYKYDSIGQLISDDASHISSITWTVYGKIASITKGGDTTLLYTYDPGGNRISKSVVHGGDTLTTWYVRDAQGNVLSVYTYGDPAVHGKDLTQTELHVYGSSRLGIWRPNKDVYVPAADPTVLVPLLGTGDSVTFTRGNKFFELTNHLGNVLVTISDKRFGVTRDSVAQYYLPDVVSANDYYPFGMLQPGRSYAQSGTGYRYGFNGKENDNEVKGVGDQIDYGMRVYDPRVGRVMSVDPLQKQFAYWAPYQFSANSPILFIDMDGLEPTKNYYQWSHAYNWTRKDYYDDDFDNYFTLGEKDKHGQPYVVRSRVIGSYPYLRTQFQYYDRDQNDYFYFIPTGFEPEYVQNLKDLKSLGQFGHTLEKIAVVASLIWSPIGRDILGMYDPGEGIDKHYTVATKERALEIRDKAAISEYQKNNVLTVAVADVQDDKGNTYRIIAINSSAQMDPKIYSEVQKTIKPNEILVSNILGGDAHAEENLNEFAKRYGLTIKSLDVSRDFCQGCSEIRRRSGASTETETSKRSRTRKMNNSGNKRP